jgi:CRP/FNR family transcriptional regulator, cyclic AMP receptor protein
MEPTQNEAAYRVWGADKVVYGPLDLSALTEWIQEARLTERSWVLLETSNEWRRAAELPELKPCFAANAQGRAVARTKAGAGFAPTALRRIKLFADLEEAQLESFLRYLEEVRCPQFSHIVRQGQRGDAMYLVLEGEVRALTIVEGKESTLTTIVAGDWFGEISLLDHGPRSVDVIANKDSVLLKLSSDAFERLLGEAPMLAVPFLLALSRTVVGRIRRATKRFEDSVRLIRTSGIIH